MEYLPTSGHSDTGLHGVRWLTRCGLPCPAEGLSFRRRQAANLGPGHPDREGDSLTTICLTLMLGVLWTTESLPAQYPIPVCRIGRGEVATGCRWPHPRMARLRSDDLIPERNQGTDDRSRVTMLLSALSPAWSLDI
jgi:hypothetical protein